MRARAASRLTACALPTALCLLLAACGTDTSGLRPPIIGIPPIINSASFAGGDDPCDPEGTVEVEWHGVAPPYKVEVDLEEPGVDPAAVTTSDLSAGITFALPTGQPAGSSINATVSVTDNRGLVRREQLSIPADAIAQPPPVIESVTVEGPRVSVAVRGTSCGEMTVRVSQTTGGLNAFPQMVEIDTESGVAVFDFSVPIFSLAGLGSATFTVEDGLGQTDTQTAESIEVESVDLVPGTLFAIPLATQARVGDTVKLIVYTGPLEHGLKSLGGVSIICPPGCEIDPASLDFGRPAEGDSGLNPTAPPDRASADGIWTQYIELNGFEVQTDPIAEPDCELAEPFEDYCAWQFHITPGGGQYIPAGGSGPLFSVNLRFTAPGDYSLSLRPAGEIPYCWYSDPLGATRPWTAIEHDLSQFTVHVSEAAE